MRSVKLREKSRFRGLVPARFSARWISWRRHLAAGAGRSGVPGRIPSGGIGEAWKDRLRSRCSLLKIVEKNGLRLLGPGRQNGKNQGQRHEEPTGGPGGPGENCGGLPAPEANHAVAGAKMEALKCKEEGVERTILFNLCGHGHFDMQVQLFAAAGFDDFHRSRSQCIFRICRRFGATQQTSYLFQRPLSCRQANALHRFLLGIFPPTQSLQSFKRPK